MASLIDENTQFLDSAGSPIVNGYIYVGTQNLDPVTNTITIYSDRELTVSISNPQRTDANGRSTNKIWVPAKYSLKVEDENNVQQYLELDNGEIEQTGISLLTNVLGTDTITAEGAPAITSLVDNQQYNFRAANTNTGTVTLQIDLTAAKTIKKFHDVDLASGDIEQNQTVAVIYNATDDSFELVSNIAVVLNNVIAETADHTSAPAAGFGELWVKDDAPNTPYFTDDAGSDFPLLWPSNTTNTGSTETTITTSTPTTTVVTATHTARKAGATLMVTASCSISIQNTSGATNDVTCDLSLTGGSASGARYNSFHDLPVGLPGLHAYPISCTFVVTSNDATATAYALRATCSDTGGGDNYSISVGGPGSTDWAMVILEIG